MLYLKWLKRINMATIQGMMQRVRLALGDRPERFQSQVDGDGTTVTFDLPVGLISTENFRAYKIENNLVTNLSSPADYALDDVYGTLTLVNILNTGATLYTEGISFNLFSDAEITEFVMDAVAMHTNDSSKSQRYKDTATGFIRFRDIQGTLSNLPEIEDPMVATLATIEAFWALANDASTDIDVITAEGTHIPRSQRYAQIMTQINALLDKYKMYAAQLNVGMFKIEVYTLRRVSMTTGRLVPIFAAREYDDAGLPQRELPEVNKPNLDDSGIPSPSYGAYYWGGY
jgi:hypothetical protein